MLHLISAIHSKLVGLDALDLSCQASGSEEVFEQSRGLDKLVY